MGGCIARITDWFLQRPKRGMEALADAEWVVQSVKLPGQTLHLEMRSHAHRDPEKLALVIQFERIDAKEEKRRINCWDRFWDPQFILSFDCEAFSGEGVFFRRQNVGWFRMESCELKDGNTKTMDPALNAFYEVLGSMVPARADRNMWTIEFLDANDETLIATNWKKYKEQARYMKFYLKKLVYGQWLPTKDFVKFILMDELINPTIAHEVDPEAMGYVTQSTFEAAEAAGQINKGVSLNTVVLNTETGEYERPDEEAEQI